MRSKNDQLVFKALTDSPRPLTAYALLDFLRNQGITAPPTIYRSLNRLMEKGFVHRIASLNAYSACPTGGDEQDTHACASDNAHVPILLLCQKCGTSLEVQDHDLTERLYHLAQVKGFTPDVMNLEILGVCSICH